MILYLYDVSSMYLSYTSKSPTDIYLCYTHYTITFYTHTHIVVVYEYHMRMTAKAVNILEFIHNRVPQTRTIVHSRVNHNCTKYDFTHVRIKHNYAQPLVMANIVTVTYVTQANVQMYNMPYCIIRTLQHAVSIYTQPHLQDRTNDYFFCFCLLLACIIQQHIFQFQQKLTF